VATAHVLFYLLLAGTVQAGTMEITDTDNKKVALSSFRGRPTLVFYEDRASNTLNQSFKDKLFSEGKTRGLLDKVNLVAVAYLKPFNFFPAKQFALQAVRGMEEKIGIPIYVDFTGELAKGLAIPTNSSTVVMLDGRGDITYKKSGKLTDTDMGEILRRL